MDSDTEKDDMPGQTATHGDPVHGSGVLEDAQALWHELHGLAHDRFQLAALETQRAGESLVTMVVSGVMVAVLLSSAWLGLMAAAVLWLVENGIVASSAILLAAAFNVLFALILCGIIRSKSRYLQFPATLNSLKPMHPEPKDAERQ